MNFGGMSGGGTHKNHSTGSTTHNTMGGKKGSKKKKSCKKTGGKKTGGKKGSKKKSSKKKSR